MPEKVISYAEDMNLLPMYHFYPRLILRIPSYSYTAYQEHHLSELIRTPFFRAAIQLASQSLYQELEKHNFEMGALPPKVVVALRKYLNRMCFRPTPFGLFSGFTVANWEDEPKQALLLDSQQLQAHAMLSFGLTLDTAEKLRAERLSSFGTYRTNSSLYKVADEYRFFRFEEDREKGGRTFFVDAVGYQSYLQAILGFCKVPRDRAAVIAQVVRETGTSVEEGEAFFEQLVTQQLLVSDWEPNITGEDYLQRLWRHCQEHRIHTPATDQAATTLDRLRAVQQPARPSDLGEIMLELGDLGMENKTERSPLYLNLERKVMAGGIPTSWQKNLLEGLDCVRSLVPVQQYAGLQRFKQGFSRKFDRRVVPLLVVLDPELGVGYEELASNVLAPKLLQDMTFGSSQQMAPVVEWSPGHALLLEKWRSASGVPPVIRLLPKDLERLSAPDNLPALPPSTSLLFRVVEDKLYLEQAGGASATALLGRFTPLNVGVYEMAAAIAQQEEKANPDIIFAELSHICEEHTANIDRRQAVRHYEIPVLVQAGVAEAFQIPLSDLLVQVEGDQVLLWSQRLRKRVVPRLSSAFNYMRNHLSAFRFLCDLQYQGLQTNFSLDLSGFFPDLDFYPRVEYKQVILSLATWRLKEERLQDIFKAPAAQQPAALGELRNELGLPRHIAITVHDHQLVFDLDKEEEIAFFLASLRQKETVTVREFPFLQEGVPVVADEKQQPYVHQFLTSLYHTQPVYRGATFPRVRQNQAAERKRKVLTGEEWVYFKLYCHSSRSNQLLTEHLLPLLQRLERKGEVKQWFFVRYQDPDFHLRVRFQPGNGHTGDLIAAFTKKLHPLVRKGIIQDFQLATYERELERYGPALIESAEAVFCASSALIGHYMQNTDHSETEYAYYGIAFITLDNMLTAFQFGLEEKVQILRSLYEAFYVEHGQSKELREQLSRKYREFSGMEGVMPDILGEQVYLADPGMRKRMKVFIEAVERLAVKVKPGTHADRVQLACDLMHMHLNRILVDHARKQELVLYYSLWRHYQSALARAVR